MVDKTRQRSGEGLATNGTKQWPFVPSLSKDLI